MSGYPFHTQLKKLYSIGMCLYLQTMNKKLMIPSFATAGRKILKVVWASVTWW